MAVEEREDIGAGERFLDWFAGFTAGEGCFCLVLQTGTDLWHGLFSITLRDDDIDILLEIQEGLRMGSITKGPAYGPANPKADFHVQRASDLMRLVAIFEAHPLRAKKQRDFEIWKRGILEIHAGRSKHRQKPTYDRAYLAYLKQKLALTRTYEGEDVPLEESPGAQLSFWDCEEE